MTSSRRKRLPALLVAAAALALGTGTAQTAHAAPAGITAEGPYVIWNYVTQKCVDLPGGGGGVLDGPVNQYDCNATSNDNQLFYLDDSNGDGDYTIRNAKDNLCLDVPNYGPVFAGTKVSEYPCNETNGDNQLYYFVYEAAWDSYLIVNRASRLCLDVDGVRIGGNNARLTLYFCKSDPAVDDHLWRLYR
ncbi:RICIN domain-containing protein [Kitasatospora sp. NPDC056184]|uniref:RICIN domain-containing protein n=1 Tax=Kitasatospora sp. NPDC056184 TaxID=3345738 RepID=UPI0035D80A48